MFYSKIFPVRQFCTKIKCRPLLTRTKELCYTDIPDYDLEVNPHLYEPVEKPQTTKKLNENSLRNIIQSIQKKKKT